MSNNFNKKNNFSWRSFISFSLFLSFFIIFISGVVLYIAPAGRISYWTVWKLLGFTKTDWQAIHTIFSYTFVIFAIFHLFSINWRTFLTYIKSKTKQGLNKSKELIIATGLTLIIFFLTWFNIQPMKAIMDFGEWTTDYWERDSGIPPIPHAEELNLKQISQKLIKISPDSILLILKQNNIKVDSIGQTLLLISQLNNNTPADIYKIILTKSGKATEKIENSSNYPVKLGKKTLIEVSEEIKIDVNKCIEILKNNEINANPDDLIKSIADDCGKTPYEIYDILTKK